MTRLDSHQRNSGCGLEYNVRLGAWLVTGVVVEKSLYHPYECHEDFHRTAN